MKTLVSQSVNQQNISGGFDLFSFSDVLSFKSIIHARPLLLKVANIQHGIQFHKKYLLKMSQHEMLTTAILYCTVVLLFVLHLAISITVNPY